MENSEHIGYIAPCDMYGGFLKAGTVIISDGQNYWKENVKEPFQTYKIPNEIVETWEKAYKMKPDFKQDVIELIQTEIALIESEISLGITNKEWFHVARLTDKKIQTEFILSKIEKL